MNTGPAGPGYGGSELSVHQSLAGHFTLNTAFHVSSLEGWMSTMKAAILTVVLYRGESLPSEELYAQQFSVTPIPGDCGDISQVCSAWCGATGIDVNPNPPTIGLLLTPGSYWIAFEVRPGASQYRVEREFGDPVMTGGDVANPLDKYAYISGGQQSTYRDWIIPAGDTGAGFRVGGSIAAVPEPGTFALIILSIGIAVIVSRFSGPLSAHAALRPAATSGSSRRSIGTRPRWARPRDRARS